MKFYINVFLLCSFILVFVIITIVICIILKKKEKFSENNIIFSPIILRVSKKKTDALVEWYNEDKRIQEFILLYTSVIPENSGVWVHRKIKCNKKKCRLILRDLIGQRYKLTILSVLNDNVSDIDDIVDFSDNNDYKNLSVVESPTISTTGTNNINISPIESSNTSNSNNMPKDNNNKNNKKNNNKNNDKSNSKKKPIINCNPVVSRENIKTKEELDNAEINFICRDDREIGELETYIEKKPFYHNTWEKIF